MTALPDVRYPGVITQELAGIARILGIGTSTGGFIGVTEWGEAGNPMLNLNWQEAITRYGEQILSSYVMDAVKAFFDTGGQRCYINRVVGTGAAKASKTLDDADAAVDDAVTLELRSQGARGNGFTITTASLDTTLATTLAAGAQTQAELTSVANVEVGQPVIILDTNLGNRVDVVVATVNPTTKIITFPSVTVAAGGIVAADSQVRSSATHKMKTTLAAAVANGDTSILISSAVNARAGMRVLFTDGTTIGTALVEAVNGNTLILAAAITLSASIAAGTKIVSVEWDLRIYESGALAENAHLFLSSESTCITDYFENRLEKDSDIMDATDESPASATAYLNIPVPVINEPLTGGLDGTAPTDTELAGSAVAPKTGLYSFDGITDVNMLSHPGVGTQVVSQAGVDYAESRKDLCYLADAPLADDTAVELQDHRNNVVNRDSTYGILYGGWVQVDNPFNPGTMRSIPPSGYAQGEWARVAAERGVHKAPANRNLPGALDLVFDATDDDQEILNPIGVNVLRKFSGRGIRIFGARTLSSIQDGRQFIPARRLLIFCRGSLKDGLQDLLFEPINIDLYTKIERRADAFLEGLWRKKMLYPSNNKASAYFAKCDEENNPESVRSQGKVVFDFGINPPPPAEQIIIRGSIFNGSVSFEEIVGSFA
jgi:hypothetical protein